MNKFFLAFESSLTKFKIKLFLQFFFTFLSSLYFFSFFFRNFDRNNLPNFEYNVLPYFAIAIFLVVFSILIVAFLWHIFLKSNSQKINLISSIVIFLISQFGKYIPGNVAHFFARASMAKNVNVPVQLSLNIMIMEIIWMIAVALFLGLFSFKGLHISTFGFLLNEPQIKWVPILSLLIFLSPWATVFLLNHFFSRTLYQSIKIKKLQFPPFFLACTSIIFFTIYFFILGLVLKIESNVFFSTFEISYFSSVSIFSLAWLAGFLMPGAPAGLGMREAVLVSFLTLWMNPLSAASLALLMRLTTTLGDGFAYLLGLFLRFKIKNL